VINQLKHIKEEGNGIILNIDYKKVAEIFIRTRDKGYVST